MSPTPYPRKESLVALAVLSGSLQASFRVPGDLAREDDLCEEIALIELETLGCKTPERLIPGWRTLGCSIVYIKLISLNGGC